jgi:hypothetical protein
MKLNIIKSKNFKQAVIASFLLITYFICVGQFWAHWWLIYLLICFFVIPLFIVVSVNTIILWIKNRSKFSLPYVPFCIAILSVLIVYCLPSHNLSKQYYKGAGSLSNYKTGACGCNLYAENYCIYGNGYMTTDLNAEYLTDSVSFRKYLGVYDDGYEHIDILCKGDSIIVAKTSSEFINTQWSKPRVLEQKKYIVYVNLREIMILTNFS